MIYLDYNATTPICEEAAGLMVRCIGEVHGNPSSGHREGRLAHEMVQTARSQVAGLIGCEPDEVVFCGCGSEANNLALKGICYKQREKGKHLIVSAVEHPAILEPANFLAREGWDVSVLPVDTEGLVQPETLHKELRDDTVLVSVMHANNETGAIQPIKALAEITHKAGALFHTDAAQSCGKIPVDVKALGVDLLTVVGHKLYGPKGVGALYVKQGLALEPVIHGAGHEGGRRAGTENVVHIAGFGAACQVAHQRLSEDEERIRKLRDLLETLLRKSIPELVLNGPREARLPNTLNVSVPGLDGQKILDACPEVAATTGSACHTCHVELSPVLKAMGVTEHVGMGALRLTLGRYTTEDEIRRAAAMISEAALAMKGGE